MVDKKAPAADWPVITGDYIVGDPESPVAVATLASHIEAELSGAAIAGPCKTENLGIEKVVANVISNPNIRFFILAGAEVQGHITGQSFKALHENGADADKKKLWHEWYICSYCGQEILDMDDAQVDHIIPFSLWWETTLENAQLLHRHCNLEKSNNIIKDEDNSWEENDDE